MSSLSPLFTIEVIREIINHNKAGKPSRDIVEKFGLARCLMVVYSVESKPDVLGGEVVFKNTRLPVAGIAYRIKREGREAITADYPYLTDDMLHLALRTDEES